MARRRRVSGVPGAADKHDSVGSHSCRHDLLENTPGLVLGEDAFANVVVQLPSCVFCCQKRRGSRETGPLCCCVGGASDTRACEPRRGAQLGGRCGLWKWPTWGIVHHYREVVLQEDRLSESDYVGMSAVSQTAELPRKECPRFLRRAHTERASLFGPVLNETSLFGSVPGQQNRTRQPFAPRTASPSRYTSRQRARRAVSPQDTCPRSGLPQGTSRAYTGAAAEDCDPRSCLCQGRICYVAGLRCIVRVSAWKEKKVQ